MTVSTCNVFINHWKFPFEELIIFPITVNGSFSFYDTRRNLLRLGLFRSTRFQIFIKKIYEYSVFECDQCCISLKLNQRILYFLLHILRMKEIQTDRSIFKNKIKFAIVVVTRIRKKKKRNSYYSSNPINVSKLRRNTLDTECVNRYPIYVPRHSDSMQLSKSSVPRDPSFHRSLLSLSFSFPFSIGTSNAYQEINFSACVTRRPQKERGVSRSQSLHKNLIIRLSGRRKTTEPRPR